MTLFLLGFCSPQIARDRHTEHSQVLRGPLRRTGSTPGRAEQAEFPPVLQEGKPRLQEGQVAAWSGSCGFKWVLLTPVCLCRTWEKRLSGGRWGDRDREGPGFQGRHRQESWGRTEERKSSLLLGMSDATNQRTSDWIPPFSGFGVLWVPNHSILGNTQYPLIGCGLSGFQGPESREGGPAIQRSPGKPAVRGQARRPSHTSLGPGS